MITLSRNIKWLLQLEGAAVLVLASITYFNYYLSWQMFALLFLLPDLALLGYLVSNRTGAILYNLTHSYLGPAVCLGLSWAVFNNQNGMAIGLIWAAHVGFDRALGYGLKYASGFKDTHLGKVGK